MVADYVLLGDHQIAKLLNQVVSDLCARECLSRERRYSNRIIYAYWISLDIKEGMPTEKREFMYSKINHQVGTVIALFICGMISLHGGITLIYLSMTSVASTSQEILMLYLSGCLGVV
ncbi:hypothetical protein ACI77I_32120, partial [Pseudomonas sp. D47]|uniref:hypothetical protein n=1 Tax=Pseudomonas sp. D47 TaxID=3159447 RepID=UPI00387B6C09